MSDTRKLTKMALLVALTGVSAYISFPIPFSPAMVTATTLVLCLIGFLLPPKEAFITICVYLLLGIIGVPVFSGGTSGLGKILGPAGGYYISYPIAYTILSMLKGKTPSFFSYFWRSAVITIPITYIFGMIGGMIVTNIGLEAAIAGYVLPFIPGDLIKCGIAAWLGMKAVKLNI